MTHQKDIYMGDEKIGGLTFQSTLKAHSSLTTQELALCMAKASMAFMSALMVMDEKTPRLN